MERQANKHTCCEAPNQHIPPGPAIHTQGPYCQAHQMPPPQILPPWQPPGLAPPERPMQQTSRPAAPAAPSLRPAPQLRQRPSSSRQQPVPGAPPAASLRPGPLWLLQRRCQPVGPPRWLLPPPPQPPSLPQLPPRHLLCQLPVRRPAPRPEGCPLQPAQPPADCGWQTLPPLPAAQPQMPPHWRQERRCLQTRAGSGGQLSLKGRTK